MNDSSECSPQAFALDGQFIIGLARDSSRTIPGH